MSRRPQTGLLTGGVFPALQAVVAVLGFAWFFLPLAANGAQMSGKQAADVVAGWLRTEQAPLQTPMQGEVLRVDSYPSAKAPVYHVVSLKPEGFVVVAADDRIEPIIAFVPRGQFAASAASPLFALVSRDLPGRTSAVASPRAQSAHPAAVAQRAQMQRAQGKWTRLQRVAAAPVAQGRVSALGLGSLSDVRVAPLIQTRWSQTYVVNGVSTNACYNYYTPVGPDGTVTNDPCGCVATSLAQLLYYWKWPVSCINTVTLHQIGNGGTTEWRHLCGGDRVGGPYNWAGMVLDPAVSSTLAQRQAIGALCYDAGIAVNENYTRYSSAAAQVHQMQCLVGTFSYSNAICSWVLGNQPPFTSTARNNMINPNLDAGAPVTLAISGAQGAHSIVCDGYGYNLSTLYHHMNMGWGGMDDGWYALPVIDTPGITYTSVDEVIYNVWPTNTGEIVSGRVLSAGGVPLTGAVVTAVRAGGGIFTATSNDRGIYALPYIPSLSTYTVSVSCAGHTFTSQVVSVAITTNFGADCANLWGVDLVSAEPGVILGLSGSPLDETGGTAVVTTTLSVTSALPVTVSLAFSGTATFGVDYTVSGTTIVIPPGGWAGSITLTGVADMLKEGDETIVVDIDTVTNAAEFGTQQVTATIRDGIAASDVPTNFVARVLNSSTVRLSWLPDAATDLVLVAWSPAPAFGTPVGIYSAGDTISGGGSVLYFGALTNATQTGLASSNAYYYQAWSVRGTRYSSAVACTATTSNRSVPFLENFNSSMPSSSVWPEPFVIGGRGWSWFLSGGRGGTPYTALFSSSGTVCTRLITPPMDFGTAATNAQLTFWLWMPWYGTTQDDLRIYYTNATSGTWQLLATLTNKVSSWTQQTVALPNPDNRYSVAFEATARDGWGVNLDDVSITACCPATNGFTTWAQVHCPGVCASNAFLQSLGGSAVPNAFAYAFGTNLVPGEALLTLRVTNGVVVVDIPQQLSGTTPYVQALLESTPTLNPPAWGAGGLDPIAGDSSKPANRAWFQPHASLSNGFFRLRGVLAE